MAERVAETFGEALQPHGFVLVESRHDAVGVWVRFAAGNRAVRIVICRARCELDVFLVFDDREYDLPALLSLAGISRPYHWAHSEDKKLVADLKAIAAIVATYAEPFLYDDSFEPKLSEASAALRRDNEVRAWRRTCEAAFDAGDWHAAVRLYGERPDLLTEADGQRHEIAKRRLARGG